MRIAIDCRKLADFGIGTYLRGLLCGLSRSRTAHEFVLLGDVRRLESLALDARFTLVSAPIPLYSLRELTAIPRLVTRHHAALLHNPHYVTPFTSVPMVTTVHDLIHLHQPVSRRFASFYAKMMIRRALTKSQWIATVSATVRAEIIALHPEVEKRISVTPNGVDETFFLRRSPGEIHDAQSRLASRRYFLFAGNDKPHKNLGRLIAAFNRISEVEEIDLVIAGAPRTIAESPRIKRLGYVSTEDLVRLYQGAVAVVVPSLEEGFGLTALEAMAAEVAVITSEAAALVELTGSAALHVDATDTDAIAQALTRIAGDADLRESCARLGAQRAREFTWDRCTELTLEIYDRVVQTIDSGSRAASRS
ncbi:MAG TPA: glycosyltransferase family 1 protein [Thermoanaerobaculia bacterium]|nr:glycosyltransferase family 1 protein [Thermoanaerobaculia bacterium]